MSEFVEAVRTAEAQAEADAVARIAEHGRTHWQANAWLLERKHPERWRRRGRVGESQACSGCSDR
ncbi:hypothetical protein NHL50_15750, partial [Acidimicrobiia bacterium EGI L10123]|nr:hypothetical protein [Acidimicrobiia bacterium EGI L10123]